MEEDPVGRCSVTRETKAGRAGRKEGRKEGRKDGTLFPRLARSLVDRGEGRKKIGGVGEREKQRDEVQKLRPRLLQGRADGRTDGRTEDAVFGLGRPRRLWLWLWVEQAEEGDRGVSE